MYTNPDMCEFKFIYRINIYAYIKYYMDDFMFICEFIYLYYMYIIYIHIHTYRCNLEIDVNDT